MTALPIHSSTRPILERAEGIHVWDVDGHRYLDATSGAFCMQLGYSRPDLVSAMSEAAARLPHARPSVFESEEAQGYRAALLRAAGPPFTEVVLTSSGSEAVDAAIKLAWRYQAAAGRPERREVLSLRGHYHGATLAALDATGWAARREPYEGLLGPRALGPPAHCVRCFRALRYPDCALACADAALERAERAAGWIAETVPAAGLAAAVPPPGYFARVRARCDAADALWVADEVLTGFGRAGGLFAWKRLSERAAPDGSRPDARAAPDLVIFGKGASAGFFPLAGVLIAERVARALDAGERPVLAHYQTFGGSPVACAVGRRVLAAFEEEHTHERVRANEPLFRRTLDPLLGRAYAYDVRGLGHLWGIELADGSENGRPFARERRVAERVAAACRKRGVLVHASVGFIHAGRRGESSGSAHGAALGDAHDRALGDAILLAPPLTSGADAIAEVTDAVASALDEITADAR